MFTGAELLCAGLNAAWPAAPAQVGACGDTHSIVGNCSVVPLFADHMGSVCNARSSQQPLILRRDGV